MSAVWIEPTAEDTAIIVRRLRHILRSLRGRRYASSLEPAWRAALDYRELPKPGPTVCAEGRCRCVKWREGFCCRDAEVPESREVAA